MSRKTQFDPNRKTRSYDSQMQRRLIYNERKPPIKRTPKEIKTLAMVTQHIAKKEQSNRRLMYFDVGYGITSAATVGVNTTSTFGNLILCTAMTQGAGQAARVSDTVWLSLLILRIRLNYNFSATSLAQDFVIQVRVTVFVWRTNSALVGPIPGSVFQNVSSTSVISLFDFELKPIYETLYDAYVPVSGFYDGTTGFAVPNPNSSHILCLDLPMNDLRVDYTPSATTATNHVYVAFTCDSVLGPAPVISLTSRMYYYNDAA